MRVDLFDFDLPPELIAQAPIRPRDAARLLLVDGGPLREALVRDLPDLLRPGDLLVLNDTRVLPTRFFARRGEVAGRGHAGRADRRCRLVGAGPARQAPAPRRHGRRSRPSLGGHRRRQGRGGQGAPRLRARGRAAARRDPVARRHAAAALHPPAQGRRRARRRRLPDRVRAPRRCGGRAHGLAPPDRGLARPPGRGRRRALLRDAPCRRRHLRPGQGRGHRRPRHARRMVRGARSHGRRRSPPPAPAAAGSSRSAPPSCARWNRAPSPTARCCPVPATRACSSRRATASAWSTCCSPTSTCRAARCSCWSPPSPGLERIQAAYAHARRRALPLLQLRRRLPADPRWAGRHDRLRAPGPRRRRPPRPARHRLRHGRDPGLHAGRHRRHGQGDDHRHGGRHRRRDRARATPTT